MSRTDGQGQLRLPWFCLWADPWLDGSVRERMQPDERGTFLDLVALASISRVRGVICSGKGIPYSHDYIARRLNIPVELLERTLQRSKEDISPDGTPRLSEDAEGITINNFEKYNRVRPPRAKGAPGEGARKALAVKVMISDPSWARQVVANLAPEEGAS